MHGVVVWEWLNELGIWKPYDVATTRLIESRKRLQRVIRLRDEDNKPTGYMINFQTMSQQRIDSGLERPVRRIIYPRDNPIALGIQWEWLSDSSLWNKYDVETNALIEHYFNKKSKSLDLYKKSMLPYTIDLEKMLQIRKDSGHKRKVRRLVLSVPYPTDEENCEQSASPPLKALALSQHVHPAKQTPTPAFGSTSYKTPIHTSVIPSSSQTNEDVRLRSSHGSPSATNVAPLTSQTVVSSNSTLTSIAMAPSNISPKMTNAFSIFTTLLFLPLVSIQVQPPPVPVFSPPSTSRKNIKRIPSIKKPKSQRQKHSTRVDDVIGLYSKRVKRVPSSSECSICMLPLSDLSSFAAGDGSETTNTHEVCVQLSECIHMFHRPCLVALYQNGQRKGFLQCPSCKRQYGVLCGNQPDGTMKYHVIPHHLPGFHDYSTIQIIYDIHHGIQGPDHPSPGQPFTARGFPRKCYLPNSPRGREALRLLVIAWERRLIFTVGRSATTGEEHTVTWNDIHHKTEFGSNTSGHGWPDHSYLDNLFSELADQGITPEINE